MPPVDPTAPIKTATWAVDGPMGLSREQLAYGVVEGRLSTDYGASIDTRFDQLELAPQYTVVDCEAIGGTKANANGFARAHALYASAEIGFIARGTDPVAVRLSDMAIADPALSLAERALGVLYAANTAGTAVISFLMAATTYHNITALAGTWPTVTPTASACNEAITNRVMFEAWPDNVIFGLGGQTIRHNDLSGTGVTMDASAWATRKILSGESFTFTGGANKGSFIVIGTTRGPIAVDNDFRNVKPIIPEIGHETTNGLVTSTVTVLNGIISNTAKAIWLINENGARPIGLEKYVTNTSPVQGRLTAFVPLEPPWMLFAYYNALTTVTHLLFGRPSVSADPYEFPVVFFPGPTLPATVDTEFIANIGTADGTRTNPAIIFGYDDDFAWMVQGRTARETDDTNYRWGASGTWYGTEMRRFEDSKKRIVYVELETANCTSDYTVQVALSLDGRTAQNVTPAITANGYQRFRVGDMLTKAEARRIKPQITLTGTSGGTSSPRVIGRLRIGYQLVMDEKGRGGAY